MELKSENSRLDIRLQCDIKNFAQIVDFSPIHYMLGYSQSLFIYVIQNHNITYLMIHVAYFPDGWYKDLAVRR